MEPLVGATALPVVPLGPAETVVDPAFASTCVPTGPAVTSAPVDAAGVDVEVEAETCEGVTLTDVFALTAGEETVVEAEAAGEPVLALVPTVALAAGVLTDAEEADDAEPAAGAVLALVVTEAPAAGELTLALTDAEGADATDTFAEVDAETGVWGAPGRPFACAGTAKERHPAAHTAAQLAIRTPRARGMTVTSVVGYLAVNIPKLGVLQTSYFVEV